MSSERKSGRPKSRSAIPGAQVESRGRETAKDSIRQYLPITDPRIASLEGGKRALDHLAWVEKLGTDLSEAYVGVEDGVVVSVGGWPLELEEAANAFG